METISTDKVRTIMTIGTIHTVVRNVLLQVGGNELALPRVEDLDYDIAREIKELLEENTNA